MLTWIEREGDEEIEDNEELEYNNERKNSNGWIDENKKNVRRRYKFR